MIVPPVCKCCGAETERLAVVMDPFMDSSYGVCADCMAPLYEGYRKHLTRHLAAAVATEGQEA